MVAGKVKMAMGLQKSPVPDPKPKSKSKPRPDSSPLISSASTNNTQKGSQGFSRSFGAYFPRASAQVQPRPPDVTELLRLVEELRERESLLKTEILEQKLLKESVAILPLLENEISLRDSEIERSKRKIDCLETENERLREETEILHMELSRQNGRYEDKLKMMENQLSQLKKANEELQKVQDNSIYNKFSKSLRKSSSSAQVNYENATAISKSKKEHNGIEIERGRHSHCDSEEMAETSDGVMMSLRSRIPHVPKPPPKPSVSSAFSPTTMSDCSTSSPSYGSLTESAERALAEISNIPPPPPLPPVKYLAPPSHTVAKSVAPPPPPPPPPTKGMKSVSAKVKRVPEVVEFYHSLMRRDSRRDSSATGGGGAAEGPTTAKDMIGEIENRSAHLLAIKTDVETQGEFIRFLIKEVENAAFIDIEDVVPFVKWLDDELSYLVDERAVLKHFDWPEQKADTLREAAFGYCDLKKLELEVSSFRDDPRQPCASALKKMQALFEKLEHGLYNLSRMRESATTRYKGFHIPIEWMLDSGHAINQIKLASVKLAMKYMKRVSAELETVSGGPGPEEEELIVQAVKFAFRVHQFAGGFDVETMRAFQELRCHIQSQTQQPHKYHHSSRSSSAY